MTIFYFPRAKQLYTEPFSTCYVNWANNDQMGLIWRLTSPFELEPSSNQLQHDLFRHLINLSFELGGNNDQI